MKTFNRIHSLGFLLCMFTSLILLLIQCNPFDVYRNQSGVHRLDGQVWVQGVEEEVCPLLLESRQSFVVQYSNRKQMMKEKILGMRQAWIHGKAKLYVQHLHKGGGTTLCKFFQRVHNISMTTINNCNGERHEHYIMATNFTTILDFMLKNKRTAVFNERNMASLQSEQDRKARSDFILITSIRHPVDRIISHMSHVYEPAMRNKADVESLHGWMRKWLEGYKDTTMSAERFEFHNHENNFQALNFLGRFGFQETTRIPLSTNNAIKQLDEFDVVIPLDNMQGGLEAMSKLFSLKDGDSSLKANARGHGSGSLKDSLRRNPELRHTYREILAENCIDIALYQRGQMMFQLMIETLRDISNEL